MIRKLDRAQESLPQDETVTTRVKRPEEWTPCDAMNRVLHAEYGSCQDGVGMPYLEALRNRVADWLDRINDAVHKHDEREKANVEPTLAGKVSILASRVENLSLATYQRLNNLEGDIGILGTQMEKATARHPSLAVRIQRIEDKVAHEDDRISDVEREIRGQREAIGLLDRRLQVLEKERKESLDEERRTAQALLGLNKEAP